MCVLGGGGGGAAWASLQHARIHARHHHARTPPPHAIAVCAAFRGQSQKPEEIYDLIEQLVPNGMCVEGGGGIGGTLGSVASPV